MLFHNGNFFLNGGFVRGAMRVTEGRIAAVGETVEALPGEDVRDLEGQTVVPGFLDVHTHGAYGVDVNHASAEDFETVCRFVATQGVTGWLCSVLTDTKEQTLHEIAEYRKWKTLPHKGARLLGIHLEGPFLAVSRKGAMPEHLLCTPDLELIREYQEAAGGEIRYITLAPELPGATEMIPALRDMGIEVSLGHSDADYVTSVRAIQNGARSATHTGNAMRLLHQHEPAIFGAVLEHDAVYCEIICDGRHLHPGTVRLILQAKGYAKAVAITDSIMAAGLPDGEYKLGVNDIVVREGDAKLKSDGSRAGSTLTAAEALKNLSAWTGTSLSQLLLLFTENPARLLRLEQNCGVLTPGAYADFVVLDKELNVLHTFVGGGECVPPEKS